MSKIEEIAKNWSSQCFRLAFLAGIIPVWRWHFRSEIIGDFFFGDIVTSNVKNS